ncbi:unnamed protein product [Vicia faba]|uniref:Uncharacterized protein n=1 Tax=Vicia faba TaxID=3906 RepID=A0AAV0ZA66_VICFA|nr:unnamed protein product [Vicia faba]
MRSMVKQKAEGVLERIGGVCKWLEQGNSGISDCFFWTGQQQINSRVFGPLQAATFGLVCGNPADKSNDVIVVGEIVAFTGADADKEGEENEIEADA